MTTANWIKQAVSGTPGTGTITLGAAETTFLGMEDWFADGENVHYFIEDGGDREEGRGVFDTTGPTITRGEIIATVVSGTLAEYPGTGLTLTSAAIVTINPSASLSLGGGTQFLYQSGRDYDLPDNIIGHTLLASVMASNVLYLYPCVLTTRRRINNFHIQVTTPDGASTDTRVGVWDQQVDGNPGNLIFDSGAIDVSGTGTRTVSTGGEIVLNPGTYWFGFKSDSTILKGQGFDAAQDVIAGGFGGVDTGQRRRIGNIAGSGGALGSNLTVTLGTSQDLLGVLFS